MLSCGTYVGMAAISSVKDGDIPYGVIPTTGAVETVPRHTEIPNGLARKICRNLSVPEIG